MVDVELTCCNGTYRRGADGIWRYPWGDAVPGAVDLALADVAELRVLEDAAVDDRGMPLAPARELAWVLGEDVAGAQEAADGERVVGMLAPELHVQLMLTVADIAELAEVSKPTVDSYRYRGYLPEPQVVKSRTPMWSRPIVRHWLLNRPGSGWRTDVYGFRERMSPPRKLPISRARLGRQAATRGAVDTP